MLNKGRSVHCVVCVYCVLFVSVYCLQKGPSIYFTFDLKGNSALVTQDSKIVFNFLISIEMHQILN
jgi:hypothetical protein